MQLQQRNLKTPSRSSQLMAAFVAVRYLRSAAFVVLFFVLFGAVAVKVRGDELVFIDAPQSADLGDITSTGHDGRQLYVEPTDPNWSLPRYRFFPPHFELPEAFSDPTPPSPAQETVRLFENTPLTVVVPQLAHFPFGAAVDVEHSIIGHDIFLRATIHHYSFATATIYGPHEFLYSLGAFEPGKYKLNFDLTQTSDFGSVYPTDTTGFIHFTVLPVPEPSLTFVLGAIAAYLILTRSSQRILRAAIARNCG